MWFYLIINSSFRPDFVLVRQYVRDVNIDWTNIIIGMQYGAVPGVNSMKALYNFRDKPWIVRLSYIILLNFVFHLVRRIVEYSTTVGC